MTAICVVGLGRMGSALARALLNAGHEVRVWNRTPGKAEALVSHGAIPAAGLEAAVAASEVVLACLIDYPAADRVLRSPAVAAALRGRLLAQLTSGAPDEARETAAWAAEHGIDYLDGAIMATPNFIGEAGASLLYAGPKAAFDRHAAVFGALGGATVHVGEDPGLASALDVALLTQMWGSLFGSLQALAVAQAEGIDLRDYGRHLQAFQPVIDGALVDLLARTREGRHRSDAETLATIAAHHGAFKHLLTVSDDRGLNRAVPEAFDSLFRAAIAAGHLEDDFAALNPFMRQA